MTGHLRAAEEIGALEIWTEPLAPGADLDPEAQRKLRACDVFAPLVSTQLLAFEAVVGRQIAIIRERQSRGEGVALYPLVLTPMPDTALDIANLRPPGGRPFSSYDAGERDRQMLDAADEIVEIAADAAALKARRRTRAPLSPLVPASPGAPRRRTDRRPARESETIEQESLEGWLTKQVPQVTAAIAARAALRVTPYWGHQVPSRGPGNGILRAETGRRFWAQNSENGRNSVRRPPHTSLTDRNCEGFCRPGNRVGLPGLHGGRCRDRTCGPSRVKGVLYR